MILPKQIRIYLLLPAAAALVFLILYIYNPLAPNHAIVLKDSILSFLLSLSCIWLSYLFVHSYPTPVAITFYAIAIAVLLSGLCAWLNYEVLQFWLVPHSTDYAQWFHGTFAIKWCFLSFAHIAAALFTAAEKRSTSLEHKLQLQSDASVLLRDAELFKLRQQLQPHFLYNSLNSIAALMHTQPEKAQEMISLLSDFLRNSVKREANDSISLKEELSYLRNYLAIESIRFGDRLSIHYEGNMEAEAELPPLLLQPLLENAIKYGLYGTIGNVEIRIGIHLKDNYLHINIRNPFDEDAAAHKGTGFGLEGIRRRLYLLYGRADLLESTKEQNLFITQLKIPQTHA